MIIIDGDDIGTIDKYINDKGSDDNDTNDNKYSNNDNRSKNKGRKPQLKPWWATETGHQRAC